MVEWKNVLSGSEFSGYDITEISVPDIMNNSACPDCKSRSCPLPAILVSRTPTPDEPLTEAITELKDTVRRIMIVLRTRGVKCRGYADGGCGYCGICAGYEACRFPTMMIRPVSKPYIDVLHHQKTDFAESVPYGLIVLD